MQYEQDGIGGFFALASVKEVKENPLHMKNTNFDGLGGAPKEAQMIMADDDDMDFEPMKFDSNLYAQKVIDRGTVKLFEFEKILYLCLL